jgi:hypothetical protein
MLPALLYPLASAVISAGGQVASNLLTRPKKRRSLLTEQLRALDESAAQNANQATANAGLQLGPALSARGMQNSGVGPQVMANLASSNYQAAAGEANKMRLPLIMGEQERQDAEAQDRAERNRQMISGLADTAATNIAGYGALQEQGTQQAAYLKKLEELYKLYGKDFDPRMFASLLGQGGAQQGGYTPSYNSRFPGYTE